MELSSKYSADFFNQFGKDYLPEYMGIEIKDVGEGFVSAEIALQKYHFAPNGYLHAGSVVTLADTVAGYACLAHLPEGANSFTTVELKTNFVGSVQQGSIRCEAKAVHLGRTTQLWDAKVFDPVSDKLLAMFRCTQLILYPKS